MNSTPPDPNVVLLYRTRSAVVNVLMGVGIGIAASGWFLRWGDGRGMLGDSRMLRQTLLLGLAGVVVVSYVLRRVPGGRGQLRDPARRAGRFLYSHVGSAAVASLAVPLGLAFGWFVRPRLDAVVPFWAAALALGVLALPRASELEGFDEPLPHSKRSDTTTSLILGPSEASA